MAIQQDFGGFDPIFPGVTISFSRSEAWQKVDSYIADSTSPPLVGSDEEKFELLSLISVLSHELRHFHDSLLSPYAIRVLRLRFHALLGIVQILPDIVKDGPNCIGVPISAWCALDEDARAKYIENLGTPQLSSKWIPVPLPYLSSERPSTSGATAHSPEAVAAIISAAVARRDQISELTNRATRDGPYSVQPWQIFELSALLVQIEEIRSAYGADAVDLFLKSLLALSPNPYAEILQITDAVWRKLNWSYSAPFAMASVVWSLFGSYEKDQWNACPAERYMRLLNHFLERGVNEDLDPTESWFDVFNRWSAALKLSTVQEGLDEARQNLIRISEAAKNITDATKMDDLLKPILQGLAAIGRAHLHNAIEFQNDPGAYISPARYLKSPTLVDPVLRVVFREGALQIPKTKSELDREGKYLHWGIEDNGGVRAFSMSFPFKFSSIPSMKTELAFELFDLFGLVDFVFENSPTRSRDDVKRPGQEFFRQLQLTPFEVF